MSLRRSSLAWLVALAAITISCNDSPTEPVGEAPAASIRLSDSVFTRGTVIRASVGVPEGYTLVAGSATWSVVSGSATLENLGGGDDSVAISLAAPGPVALGVTYTLRGVGAGSGSVGMTPTRRPAGNVIVETSRSIVVAAPIIDFTTLPTASVTAGNSLGDMRVSITDARGRVITSATDSIIIALDATSGGGAGVLLGTLRARATAGVATFSGTSIQKAGTGYRIIASSPTLSARDTAATSIVAGAPTAAQSSLVLADTVRAVTQTTTATVTVRDQYGNPVLTAAPTAFSATASVGTIGAFSCANGVCTATYTAPTTPATASLSATLGGAAIGGAPRAVTVTAGAAAKLTITGSATQTAGAANTLTITAFDAQGNVATGYTGAKSLTFSGAANALAGTVPSIGGANQGTATSITFTNGVSAAVSATLFKAESATLAVTDGTIAAAGADRLTVAVASASASAAQSSLAIADSVRTVGQTTTVTVTLKDTYGNAALSGAATDFAAAASAGSLGAFSCSAGVCTATYTAPAAVATHSITATIGGTAIQGSPKTVRVPDSTAPAILGPSGAAGDATSAASIAERSTAVHTFTADEAATWSVSGIDAARFTIDSTGALSFRAAPDYEAATDADANNAYLVTVTATDVSGNAASQAVTVSVTNVDDTAPSITGPSGAAGAATSATNRAENGTAVAALTANEAVTWSITGGADSAQFVIDSTGALAFVVAPNFEAAADADSNNTYVVTVTATDATPLANASSQTVTVTVTDVDEIAPAITGPSGAAGAATSVDSIPENTTAVATLTADEAATWSISGGADSASFTIDRDGALAFAAAPDFEAVVKSADADNDYVVTVTATDSLGNASAQTVTVTVTNVAPTITGPSGAAGATASTDSVPEGTTAIYTMGTTDSVGTTWSLVTGGDAASFTIDAGGTLAFAAAADFESPTDRTAGDGVAGNNVYVVEVRATDGVFTRTQTVTVTVTNIADEGAPDIQGPSGAAGAATSAKTINENLTAVATFTANEAVTWSLSGGADSARFTMNSGTGALAFAAAPDFENPTDAGTNNTYVVTVRAADPTGNASTQTVTVTVANVVDETAPAITGPSGAARAATSTKTIAENGTAVHTMTANEAATWSLSGGADSASFTIVSGPGTSAALSFVSAPDFEAPTDADTDNAYEVTVRAVDATGNASTQTVTVTVTDLDEIAPVIQGPSGAAGDTTSAKSLAENRTAVYRLTANESVAWSLAAGADSALFEIDSLTGDLAFLAAPDFETAADADTDNVYEVTVGATDAAGNTATQAISVTITDVVDETAPQITGPSGAAGAATAVDTIPENTTMVDTLTADEAVTWTLLGADQAKFQITTGGVLTFIAAPDHETPASSDADNDYEVGVVATDASGNVSTQTVTVTVTNVDDDAPVITGPAPSAAGAATSAKAHPENAASVHTFTSDDAAQVWAIAPGLDGAKFEITALGELRFLAAPDYEAPTDADANNTYVVRVTARDALNNTSLQTVTVTVTDVDEIAPILTGPTGGAGAVTSTKTIAENTTAVHTMTASEAVTWTLGGVDTAAFAITAGGALSFRSPPDFETPTDSGAGIGNNTYVVAVTGTDTAGNAATQTVTVTVTNVVDEVAPLITNPGSPSIVENTTAVVTMVANETVTWSIDGGADAAAFVIDATLGALRFATAPNYEAFADAGADNVYDVTVKATDPTGNSSTQAVAVTVTDVDDVAPVITGPSGAAGAATSATTYQETGVDSVFAFTATEVDNPPVTWGKTTAFDGAKFAISATGVLTFVSSPDYETPTDLDGNNTYQVVITAADALGNLSSQLVTVVVTDLDEIAPVITGPNGGAGAATSTKSVAENRTTVHTFTASESVTWSKTGGADSALFTINAGTGALSFVSAPDFETPLDADANNTYEVTVTATDGVALTASQTLTVTITDLDDTAPLITGPSGAAGAATSAKSINEGTTAVATLTANETVTWGKTGGADSAFFTINPTTGELTISARDFETRSDAGANNTYEVTITAVDASVLANSSSQTVIVTIVDVDEIAPVIEGPAPAAPGSATSSITVANGTTAVHTFTANESVTWSLEAGVGDVAAFTIDATTGALAFVTPRPADIAAGDGIAGNNVYVVRVRATDALGNTTTQLVTVTVTP